MRIKPAKSEDASIIHNLMLEAFSEYNNPPSSAMNEKVGDIKEALENGELSLICYDQEFPVAMVRFKLTTKGLYFYRLSVTPTYQRKGIAKQLLQELEFYAAKYGVIQIVCKVRMTASKNISLYQSIGYEIDEQISVRKANGAEIPVVHMKKQLQIAMLGGS